MDEKQVFLEGLKTIRNVAALKNGRISVPDILAAFPGVELEDYQVALIYDYLDRENIQLEAYEPHDVNTIQLEEAEAETWGVTETEREQRIYEMYQSELAALPTISSREEEDLACQLLDGTEPERMQAAQRLTEGNLRWVVQMARDHSGQGVPLPDLIQEGNLALWESVLAYEGQAPLTSYLEKRIQAAMKKLIRESGQSEAAESQMALMANRILETVKEMEEELDREISAPEISEKTGIPVSRVEEVLRESARALKNAEK